MFSASSKQARNRVFPAISRLLPLAAVGVAIALALPAHAQDQSSGNGQQTQPPPEAGGPNTDVGPYAIPRKKEEPPPPPPPTKPKAVEGMPDYSIQVNVPLVEVPVSVTTKDGQFISNLTKDNFRVFEDGVQQSISGFNISDAPITAVLLVEFAAINYHLTWDAVVASYSFAQSLKKDDWVAVEYYDMKPQILVDFTQDKGAIYGALRQMRIPAFSETNIFDALYDTLDRVDRIEGHKYIIIISSGYDSFSRINLDQIYKKIKNTKDVTIYPVSIGWIARAMAESRGGAPGRGLAGGVGNPVTQVDYLQADNEMQTYAKITGGHFYQPRFEAEYAEVFHDIAGDIRNRYQIAYRPTNPKLDGSYRKLKVEVVAPDGGPLKIRDQKGKDVKFQIIAREGYTAKHTVE